MRRFLFVACAAIACAAPARADTVPVFTNVPSTYVPGTSFTFNVSIPGLTNLGDYNVELTFQTIVDPTNLLTVTATPPSNLSQYPFGTLDNFLVGGPFTSGNSVRLTLSDFTLNDPGVTTVAGQNDLLAQVTVSPGAGLTGPITIGVTPDSLEFDTAGGDPISVIPPTSQTVNPPPGAVPAPPGHVLAGIALGLIGLRRRRQTAR